MITKELQRMKPLKGNEKFERDSEYMGADDIDSGAEPILTIKNLYRGKVTLQRGPEVKNVLTFVEEKVPGISEVRPLIINATNRQVLKKLYKEVTANALEGKKIQLWIEHGVRNPSKNELTDGIRIRDKAPMDGKAYTPPTCEDCGRPVTGMNSFTPEQLAAASKQKYGRCLCVECAQKAKAALEAEKNKATVTASVAAKEEEVTASVEAQDNDLAAQLLADAE